MKLNPQTQSKLRRYLLGQADEAECEAIERAILTDDELFEELLVVEDELVDQYVRGNLTSEEVTAFENRFLRTAEHRERVRFGQAFNRYLSAQTAKSAKLEKPSRSRQNWLRGFFFSPVRVGACAIVVLIIALVTWFVFFRQSEVEKGLLALNAAYREQRPIEARISNLDYAPYVTTRGPEIEKVNENELSRAELLLREALNKNPTPAARHALGEVFLTKREFDRAIEQFDLASKGDSNNPQLYADLGAAWLEKGKLERGGDEPGKAMVDLGRAMENLNKALQLNSNLLQARFNRALCEEQLMLYSQAENDWREYLKQEPQSLWAEEARRRLQQLEEQQKRRSQTSEELLNRFQSAFESRDDGAAWSALSRSRSRTGNLITESFIDEYLHLTAAGRKEESTNVLQKLNYAGDLEEAKVSDSFTRDLSRTLIRATPHELERIAKARQLIKQGIARYSKSEFNEAIDLFSTAQEEFLQARDECERLFAEAWIGYCKLRLQSSEQGTQIFEHLSKVFAARNYKSLLAQAVLAQADALTSRNEFSKVLQKSNESFTLSQQIQDTGNAIRCLQANTSVNLTLGDYRESLGASLRALELAATLPPDAKITWPFYHESSLDFHLLGLQTPALLFEQEALRLATATGLPLQASRSYDRLALIHEHLGNYADAITTSDLARAEGEKINDQRTRKNVLAHAAMVLGRLYRETGSPQRAVDSYETSMALYRDLDMDLYQYQAHKGKLLALMQLNDLASAQSELDATLYWFEQNREKIAEERFRDKFFDTEQDTYDLAVDFTYSKKNDWVKAFDYAEASRARSLHDLMTQGVRNWGDGTNPELKLDMVTPALSGQEIQQRLPNNNQLLEYSVLDDKTIIWVLTKDSLKAASSPISRDALNLKIQAYLQLLTRVSPNFSDIKRQAEELYTSLILPAEKYLNRNLQLCLIPDDKLNFLPFATLVSPETGRYLLEDYTLETASSATVFIASSDSAKGRESGGPERLLAVGNPRFDREQFKDLPDLPSAKREAEEIAALYNTIPLTDDRAVADRVRAALKQVNVAHFATHAVTDDESPLLSKLLLATDRNEMNHAKSAYITAGDIYRMKLSRTQLVVLSACQTGIEKSYRGEGAIGLARPFIAAGVPLVVATLWPVESEATADLMVSFHKHRKQDHVSTVEALRRAQLEALHNLQSDSQRRYDWAAFVVIGGYAAF